MNTPVVAIQYHDGKSTLLFRCFDQWHWPATRRANDDLYRRLLAWRDAATTPAGTAAPPDFSGVHGTAAPPLSIRAVLHPVRTYGLYAMVGNCVAQSFTVSEGFQFSGLVLAPLLTAGILLMILVPQMGSSRR